MTEFEQRVRDGLHGCAVAVAPPADLDDRVLRATVHGGPAPRTASRRVPFGWLSIAASVIAVAGVSTGLVLTGGHPKPGGPAVVPGSPTPRYSASPLPTSSPTASSGARPTATASHTPGSQKPWYDSPQFTRVVDGLCTASGPTVVEQEFVFTSPSPIVAVEWQCAANRANSLAFISDGTGKPTLTFQEPLPASVRNLAASGGVITWMYDASAGIGLGGLETWKTSISPWLYPVPAPVDATPECSAAGFGHGTLTYRQGVIDGVWFPAPSTPCWVPMYGFSLSVYDKYGHLVESPYSGIQSAIAPRFYVTDPSSGYAFYVNLNIGSPTYYSTQWCLPGETQPVTTLKIRFSWGTTQTYQIAPEWMCNTSAGEMSLGKQYPY